MTLRPGATTAVPYDRQAEEEIVGALLLEPARLSEVRTIPLAETDFFCAEPGAIYRAMLAALTAGARIDDLTGLGKRLAGACGKSETEWHVYLAGLWSNNTPTATDILYNAKKVHDHAVIREFARTLEGWRQDLLSGAESSPGDALQALQAHVASLRINKGEHLDRVAPRAGDLLPGWIRRIGAIADGIAKPIATPWPVLTKALRGGFRPGVHYLTGPTGLGKTQFASQVTINAAEHGLPVLYVGLELSADEINTRLLAALEGVPWSDLGHGDVRLYKRVLENACPKLAELPIHIEEGPAYGWHAGLLGERVRELRMRYPEDPDKPGSMPLLVVLDYLQVVAPEPGAREDLRQRIAKAAYAARQATRDPALSAVVLALSSISRENARMLREEAPGDEDDVEEGESNGRKAPKKKIERFGEGDPSRYVGLGKEAGELEFSGHSVMVFCEEKYRAESLCRRVHIAIAKHRDGPLAWVDPLLFDGTSFREPRSNDPFSDD